MVMKTSKGWVKAEGHYFLKLDFCLEYWEVSNADPDNRILFFNSRDNFLIYYFDFMFSILEDLELMHKHIVESVAKYNFLQCSFSEALSNRGIYLTLLGMRVHAFNLFKLIRLARLLLTLKTLKTFFSCFGILRAVPYQPSVLGSWKSHPGCAELREPNFPCAGFCRGLREQGSGFSCCCGVAVALVTFRNKTWSFPV